MLTTQDTADLHKLYLDGLSFQTACDEMDFESNSAAYQEALKLWNGWEEDELG